MKAPLLDELRHVITPTLAIQKPNIVAIEDKLHKLSYGKKSDSLQIMPAKMPAKNNRIYDL